MHAVDVISGVLASRVLSRTEIRLSFFSENCLPYFLPSLPAGHSRNEGGRARHRRNSRLQPPGRGPQPPPGSKRSERPDGPTPQPASPKVRERRGSSDAEKIALSQHARGAFARRRDAFAVTPLASPSGYPAQVGQERRRPRRHPQGRRRQGLLQRVREPEREPLPRLPFLSLYSLPNRRPLLPLPPQGGRQIRGALLPLRLHRGGRGLL